MEVIDIDLGGLPSARSDDGAWYSVPRGTDPIRLRFNEQLHAVIGSAFRLTVYERNRELLDVQCLFHKKYLNGSRFEYGDCVDRKRSLSIYLDFSEGTKILAKRSNEFTYSLRSSMVNVCSDDPIAVTAIYRIRESAAIDGNAERTVEAIALTRADHARLYVKNHSDLRELALGAIALALVAKPPSVQRWCQQSYRTVSAPWETPVPKRQDASLH